MALWCHPAFSQSFDTYGGDVAQTCTNTSANTATPHFELSKVGNRWWFCTPLGHVMFANQTQPLIAAQNACQTNTFNSCTTAACGQNSALNWTVYSGNIYQATVDWTVASVLQSPPTNNPTSGGTTLTKESSLAAMVAGSWYQTGTTLYVETTTGVSPATLTMGYPDVYTACALSKYGDTTYNYYWQQELRMKHWNFNAIGQIASPTMLPDNTCNGCIWPGGVNPVQMPYFLEEKPTQYSEVNLNNYEANGPVHSILQGVTTAVYPLPGAHWATVVDAFDPKWADYIQQTFAKDNSQGTKDLRSNSPWLMGIEIDDSDYFWGSGCGPDFVCGGKTGANSAWITLVSSPLQAYATAAQYSTTPHILYLDTKNYSKSQATNPAHGACSTNNPCSLRDYLFDEYSGNISLVDNAWGANYTSFDSTGTPISGEVIGTGDGTTTTFTHTLTHLAISPFSVQVFVGGVAQGGDCPWFEKWPLTCGASLATNTGVFGSKTANYLNQVTSTINYTTGAVTLVFGTAPANGASITVNYVQAGWMAGGTGLMDESGSSPWVGTNYFCLEGADANYPTYYVCTGTGGNQEPLPSLAFQSTGISVAGGTTTLNFTPAKTGGYTFANNQNVYIQGSPVAACNGGPYVITMVSNTATSGTIPTPAGCTTAAAGGWVNSAVAVDLDNWERQFAAKYFKTIHDDIRNANNYGYPGSNIPYLGLDDIGAWYSPAYSKFMQGAVNADNPTQPYIDMAFVVLRSDLSSVAAATSAYQYTTQYLGDIPLGNFQTPVGQPDSALGCITANIGYGSDSTQLAAGQHFYDTTNWMLNTLSHNNTYQWVMNDHWAWQDFQNANQGLVTAHDNAYDGIEAVVGVANCEGYYSSSVSCGNEPASFGDSVTNVANANALWLGLVTPSPAFSYSPSPVAFGTVNVGSNSPLTTTITNSGNANLVLGTLGAPSDSEFAISADLCSGQTLAANGTCTFTLTFAPTSAGVKTATISVPDNAGNPDTISANGTGQSVTTYTLTVSKSGAGAGTVTSTDGHINCGATCSFSYSPGSQVTLSASPSGGSAFIGWSGGSCSGTGSCVVTMNGNVSVTPTFNVTTPHGRSKKLIF